jgi:thioredoxin-like negative regulator of GroEL
MMPSWQRRSSGWSSHWPWRSSACRLQGPRAQEWDKKTVEKMLEEGARKLASAKADEREEGAGYILGYITCACWQPYQAILIKAPKDPSPKVRTTAAQTLEKIQAVDAVPDLIALLDDPNDDVRVRARYALGRLGAAARSAEPALKKTRDAARAQRNSMVEGTMENALDETSGKKPSNRYKCP